MTGIIALLSPLLPHNLSEILLLMTTTDIVISSPASPLTDYGLWPVQIQD
jgi:hypothetical protein